MKITRDELSRITADPVGHRTTEVVKRLADALDAEEYERDKAQGHADHVCRELRLMMDQAEKAEALALLHGIERDAAREDRDKAEAALRASRTHGGCHEDLMAEVAARAEAERLVEALTTALMEASEHMRDECPTTGWGTRDVPRDNDRVEVLGRVRAALKVGASRGGQRDG